MCVIVVKPKGVSLPSKDDLRKCYNYSDDGVGFAYANNNRIYLKKGYKNFDKFYSDALIDIKKGDPCIIHFRLASSGKVNTRNQHPFVITDDLDIHNKKELATRKIVLAHNGNFSITERFGKSDTLQFAMMLNKPSIYNSIFDDSFINFVEIIMEGNSNKLAFLNRKGKIVMLGSFTKDNNCYYSNTIWKSYLNKSYYYEGYYYNAWNNNFKRNKNIKDYTKKDTTVYLPKKEKKKLKKKYKNNIKSDIKVARNYSFNNKIKEYGIDSIHDYYNCLVIDGAKNLLLEDDFIVINSWISDKTGLCGECGKHNSFLYKIMDGEFKGNWMCGDCLLQMCNTYNIYLFIETLLYGDNGNGESEEYDFREEEKRFVSENLLYGTKEIR